MRYNPRTLSPFPLILSVGLSLVVALIIVSLRLFVWGASGFPVHFVCWRGEPGIILLHVAGDLLVWAAYNIIPALVLYIFVLSGARSSRDLLPSLQILAALFIWFCGMTHFLDIVEVWIPVQWSRGIIKVITGIVSIAFAVELARKRIAIANLARAALRAYEIEHAIETGELDITQEEPA